MPTFCLVNNQWMQYNCLLLLLKEFYPQEKYMSSYKIQERSSWKGASYPKLIFGSQNYRELSLPPKSDYFKIIQAVTLAIQDHVIPSDWASGPNSMLLCRLIMGSRLS